MVIPDAEKPLAYKGTHTANTSSARVSETIVAPVTTTMGSRLRAPSLATMVEPSIVCEASSDPTTMAGSSS